MDEVALEQRLGRGLKQRLRRGLEHKEESGEDTRSETALRQLTSEVIFKNRGTVELDKGDLEMCGSLAAYNTIQSLLKNNVALQDKAEKQAFTARLNCERVQETNEAKLWAKDEFRRKPETREQELRTSVEADTEEKERLKVQHTADRRNSDRERDEMTRRIELLSRELQDSKAKAEHLEKQVLDLSDTNAALQSTVETLREEKAKSQPCGTSKSRIGSKRKAGNERGEKKRAKTYPVVTFTSFEKETRRELTGMAQSLGATVLSRFSSQVTHVVTPSLKEAHLSTIKALSAALAGKYLITDGWIRSSHNEGDWNDEGRHSFCRSSSMPLEGKRFYITDGLRKQEEQSRFCSALVKNGMGELLESKEGCDVIICGSEEEGHALRGLGRVLTWESLLKVARASGTQKENQ